MLPRPITSQVVPQISRNGEAFHCSVEDHLELPRSRAGPDSSWSGRRPRVVARYLVDDRNAHSDEFQAYHRFLGGLAGGASVLAGPFRADEWEQTGLPSGRWGRLLVEGELVLAEGALDALLAIDADDYWRSLARELDWSPRRLESARRALVAIGRALVG